MKLGVYEGKCDGSQRTQFRNDLGEEANREYININGETLPTLISSRGVKTNQ
jgi:hypothetical protein